jgi:hypothetical protein
VNEPSNTFFATKKGMKPKPLEEKKERSDAAKATREAEKKSKAALKNAAKLEA